MYEDREKIEIDISEEAREEKMEIMMKTEKRKRGRPTKEEGKTGGEQEGNRKITDWWKTDTDGEREEEEEGEKTVKKPDGKKTPQKEEDREKAEKQENISMVSLVINKMEDIKREITKGKIELKEEVNGLAKKIKDMENKWQTKEEELCRKMMEMMNKMEVSLQKERIQREEERKKLMQEVLQKAEEKVEEKLKTEGRRKEDTDKEVRDLGVEMRKIRRELEAHKKRERRNNIVVKGIKVEKKGAKETIEQFFIRELEVKAEIKAVTAIGIGEEVSMVVVEMRNWEAKQEIMKKKGRLGKKKIYIDHDLTEEERYVQRKLRERARMERNQNKEAKVGYRKIKIQEKWYRWDENKEEIKEWKDF